MPARYLLCWDVATGTNEKEAVKILQGIGMTALSDMDEAVSKVVALVREAA